VLEPAIAVVGLVQVSSNAAALLVVLALKRIATARTSKAARTVKASVLTEESSPAAVLRRSGTSSGMSKKASLKKQSETLEQARFSFALGSLVLGLCGGIVSEGSREAGRLGVPKRVIGNDAASSALICLLHLAFFLQALMFLKRYIAFSKATARSAGAQVQRNPRDDATMFWLTAAVVAVTAAPFLVLLLGAPVAPARTTWVLGLGVLVFVMGFVFAPSTIRPTLDALRSVGSSGFEDAKKASRIKSTIKRLELLTLIARVAGLQVPLLCIAIALVPVLQSLVPYLVVQAQLLPPVIIVLEQFVLMPIRSSNKAADRPTNAGRAAGAEQESSSTASAASAQGSSASSARDSFKNQLDAEPNRGSPNAAQLTPHSA
jgi:hypothetical protein